MRKVFAWLGAATFMLGLSSLQPAQAANEVLKPYVVLILDTSGSMNIQTQSGPTSCGKKDTRLNHAVCAINSIVNSYGDMVLGFGRFRETTASTSGTAGSQVCDTNGDQEGNPLNTFPTPTGGDVCNTQGAACHDCNPLTNSYKPCIANASCQSNSCANIAAETACGTDTADNDSDGRVNDGCAANGGTENATFNGSNGCNNNDDDDLDGQINDGCPATGQCTGVFGCTNNDREFELLSALVDGNNAQAAEFTNGSCNACSVASTAGAIDPEIWGVGQLTFTPLSATLSGVRRYWQGQERSTDNSATYWAATTDNVTNNPGFDPINRDPSAHVFLPANDAASCERSPTSCAPFTPESNCGGQVDDDGDLRINDGCPTGGTGNAAGPEADCADTDGGPVDDDGDGLVNDGCPAWCNGTSCCCASQCRPYITILLTDGEETCTTFTNTIAATTALKTTQPRQDTVNITQIARDAAGLVTVTTGTVTYTNPAIALPHPFKAGDEVFVITPLTNAGGTVKVLAVPSATTFTYQTSTLNNPQTVTVSPGTVRHTAFLYRYTIKTVPIGFGITPPVPPALNQVEQIAHAGGTPDLPGQNEGYYAQDEADLELAISTILADSVRSELCNNKDDDCDTFIDEDFKAPIRNPGLTGACTNGLLGACAANGTLQCTVDGTGLVCNAPTIAPGNEGTVCNSIDDDCDGRIDENLNCTSCVPTNETCNNADQDCDGVADKSCRCANNPAIRCNTVNGPDVDQCGSGGNNGCVCTDLTRPCGVGTCAGIETCTAGSYTGCTATPSVAERCDGRDNDCDGLCDGFTVDCSEQVAMCNNTLDASCPATDSLGHPSKNPIPQNICRPGTRQCALVPGTAPNCGGSNTYSICSGEVKACGPDATPGMGCDTCNGLDDDCDNVVDEDFRPAACDDNCGLGTTSCVNGQIQCNSTAAMNDTTCDNNDDDCDGKFDENWVCPDLDNNQVCDQCGQGMVCMGIPKCIMGQVQCQGGPINNEVCNCLDDDCDGQTDEPTVCPGGSTCTNCQCAFTCAMGEFPCPLGKKCDTKMIINGAAETACVDNVDDDNDGTINDGCGYCVNDPCFNVTCQPVMGNLQTCVPKPGFPNEPQCVDTCSTLTTACPTGYVCFGPAGECRPNDCQTFPSMCQPTEACIIGQDGFGDCVGNPCATVTCEGEQYCVGGTCVSSCADVECADGKRCRQGVCEDDPCGGPCPFGKQCNDTTGQCINDPCKDRNCGQGQWCNPNNGQCEEDACVSSGVTCPNPGEVCRGGSCFDPEVFEADAGNEKNVTVGGGGGCTTGGGNTSALVAFALLGLLASRRRRTVGGAL